MHPMYRFRDTNWTGHEQVEQDPFSKEWHLQPPVPETFRSIDQPASPRSLSSIREILILLSFYSREFSTYRNLLIRL